jgi:hypothetical protein
MYRVMSETKEEETISTLESENNILVQTTSLHLQRKMKTEDIIIETETLLP